MESILYRATSVLLMVVKQLCTKHLVNINSYRHYQLRYGSTYSGELYKDFLDNIREESNDKIKNPSISFMEYYVARKMGKRIYVFVDETVYNEKQIYSHVIKGNTIYDPVFADKVDIFHIINFITHQKVDNWFRLYSDLHNLD